MLFKGELEFIHYFCGNTEIPSDLKDREPLRAVLYKAAAGFMRAYANLADELEPAGYTPADIASIQGDLNYYLDVREIVRKASGETLDLKPYEADMRHLIDTYIEADEPRKISPFDDLGLVELIVKTGMENAINNRLGGLKGNRNAIAETIENNVRRTIIKEHLNDPAYFEKMSKLLNEIIAARKAKATRRFTLFLELLGVDHFGSIRSECCEGISHESFCAFPGHATPRHSTHLSQDCSDFGREQNMHHAVAIWDLVALWNVRHPIKELKPALRCPREFRQNLHHLPASQIALAHTDPEPVGRQHNGLAQEIRHIRDRVGMRSNIGPRPAIRVGPAC